MADDSLDADDDEVPPPPYPVEFSAACHDKGDVTCAACTRPYPMKCTCGGLVHADNNWERGQFLMLDVGVNALDLRCERYGKVWAKVEKEWVPTPE